MPATDGSGDFGKLNKQLWRGVDPVMIGKCTTVWLCELE